MFFVLYIAAPPTVGLPFIFLLLFICAEAVVPVTARANMQSIKLRKVFFIFCPFRSSNCLELLSMLRLVARLAAVRPHAPRPRLIERKKFSTRENCH
jgi:hypothetical protein